MRALPPILAALVAALLAWPTAVVSAPPTGKPARSAAGFVDSVGVNLHMGFPDKAYANTAGVLARLRELGVRHVRDGVLAGRPDQHRALAALGRAGIRLTLITADPAPQAGPLGLRLPVALNLRRSLDAVEGANEYDHAPHFAQPLNTSQRELYGAVKSSVGSSTPVLAPSLAFGGSIAELAALGPLPADIVNIHPYPGGRPPEQVELAEQVNRARSFAPVNPAWATETGYHDGSAGSQPGVSERGAEAYIPRLLLHNYSQGIAKTFLYELADEGPASVPDQEAHFGLVRDDLSPKPSFYALKRLLAQLDDGGGARTGSLSYDLTSTAPGLRQELLRRCDGSYALAFWQEAAVYDNQARVDLAPAPATATLRLGRPATGVRLRPTAAADQPISFAGSRRTFRFPATPRVQVLVVPAAAPVGRRAAAGGARLRRTAGGLAAEAASRGAACLRAPHAGPLPLSGAEAGRYRIVVSIRRRTAATGTAWVRRGRPALVRLRTTGRRGARLLSAGAKPLVTVRFRAADNHARTAARVMSPLRP